MICTKHGKKRLDIILSGPFIKALDKSFEKILGVKRQLSAFSKILLRFKQFSPDAMFNALNILVTNTNSHSG